MDFSISTLAAGFIAGVFGFYLLKLGRKSANVWHIVIGIALMAYPYFVSGSWLNWGLGAALLTLAYFKR